MAFGVFGDQVVPCCVISWRFFSFKSNIFSRALGPAGTISTIRESYLSYPASLLNLFTWFCALYDFPYLLIFPPLTPVFATSPLILLKIYFPFCIGRNSCSELSFPMSSLNRDDTRAISSNSISSNEDHVFSGVTSHCLQ